MKKKIFNKVTLITSPRGRIGTTTIANNLGYIFAKEGYLTAVIELNRQCGSSPYLNFINNDNTDKSLKTAMESYDEEEIIKNFMQSKHHDGLFTLSLRQHDELHSLYKFSSDQIQRIIKVARKKFDKVFIDSGMCYVDNGFIASLNIHPDQIIQILDEDIVSWHKLKLYEDFIKNTNMKTFSNVITIINKHQDLLSDKLVVELKREMKILRLDRVYTIPYLKRIIKANNEGELLADIIPVTKNEKRFVKTLKSLYEEISNPNTEKESKEISKNSKGLSFNLFSKKKHKEKIGDVEKGDELSAG
ncbi:MAG: hypothetical protein N4A68_11795 [Maledivibacter sp.]|jgi:septum formation inhibitor-activating ATPase MinD|nr:hypothetical protein [Maledivibacter sp.]